MAHEIELKFDLAPEHVARLKACPSLAAHQARTGRYDTLYYDTPDGALRRAGCSLRVRRAGRRFVQSVKRKRGAAAGLFVRQEWERETAGLAVDRDALATTPLKRLLAGPLEPTIRTRFRRTAWQLVRGDSRVEVVLDEGRVTAGRAGAPLCELELELVAGKPRALFELAEEIGRAVPLRLGVLTKAGRGQALAERSLGRPARAEPVALAAGTAEGEAFRAVAHACLRHYRLNEIVLLGARDAEALHQARIALRRLRSAFSLFRPTARGKDYQALRDELGWLAGQFGDARNLDVLLAGADEPQRARLGKRRERAYDRVERALAAPRTRALMLRLALWTEIGPWRFRERAERPVDGLAAHRLERLWRKIRRHGAGLAAAGPDERHNLRLDVKKLRYAAEFLAGLWPKRAKAGRRDRFIAALKDLQDRLGELNDAEAARTALRHEPPVAGIVAAAEQAYRRAVASACYWTEA